MALDMGVKNARDLANGVWGTWFFYGATGAGKTELASSFPRPLFIVPRVEGSIETLRGQDYAYLEVSSDPKAKLVDGVGSIDAILDRLETVYRQNASAFPYDTIVVEAITHLSDIIVMDLSQNGKLIMDQSKWGLLANRLIGIHTRLKALDVHVIYTALDQTEKITDTQLRGGPMLSGKTADKLPASCTVIGYVERYGESRHRVHFQDFRHFKARTRFKRMPKLYEGPFNEFYAAIQNTLDPDDI